MTTPDRPVFAGGTGETGQKAQTFPKADAPLRIVSDIPDRPGWRSRWKLRLNDDRTVFVSSIHSARLLDEMSATPTASLTTGGIAERFGFNDFQGLHELVSTTQQELAASGVELPFSPLGFSLRDTITERQLRVMQTAHILESPEKATSTVEQRPLPYSVIESRVAAGDPHTSRVLRRVDRLLRRSCWTPELLRELHEVVLENREILLANFAELSGYRNVYHALRDSAMEGRRGTEKKITRYKLRRQTGLSYRELGYALAGVEAEEVRDGERVSYLYNEAKARKKIDAYKKGFVTREILEARFPDISKGKMTQLLREGRRLGVITVRRKGNLRTYHDTDVDMFISQSQRLKTGSRPITDRARSQKNEEKERKVVMVLTHMPRLYWKNVAEQLALLGVSMKDERFLKKLCTENVLTREQVRGLPGGPFYLYSVRPAEGDLASNTSIEVEAEIDTVNPFPTIGDTILQVIKEKRNE